MTPKQAFALVGAYLLEPATKEKERAAFNLLFPNLIRFVGDRLVRDGVLTGPPPVAGGWSQ